MGNSSATVSAIESSASVLRPSADDRESYQADHTTPKSTASVW
jgi:hypothetical protein